MAKPLKLHGVYRQKPRRLRNSDGRRIYQDRNAGSLWKLVRIAHPAVQLQRGERTKMVQRDTLSRDYTLVE